MRTETKKTLLWIVMNAGAPSLSLYWGCTPPLWRKGGGVIFENLNFITFLFGNDFESMKNLNIFLLILNFLK